MSGSILLSGRIVPRDHQKSSNIDERQFRALAKRVMPSVYRILRRFGVFPEDLEDALQMVLLALAKHWSKLDLSDSRRVTAYAATIARNVARDVRRLQRARGLLIGGEFYAPAVAGDEDDAARIGEWLLDASENPEERIGARESIAIVDAILASIPSEWREVFVLYEIEGFKTREIAEILSLPEGTVASRLRSARTRFEQLVHARDLAGCGMAWRDLVGSG